ncbi:hypothetical protein RSK20926_01202 [Roseobacter sp. SK209-2-6]|nr:hypothetical protein RSK20926_01202 [Roseobacter sp. SK209-2-6]
MVASESYQQPARDHFFGQSDPIMAGYNDMIGMAAGRHQDFDAISHK